MTMEHKAFLMNYVGFQKELQPTLEEALATGRTEALESFIDQYRSMLRDPNEGTPLPDDWRSLVEPKDVHQFGDLALTRYYNPQADIGIGHNWQAVERELRDKLKGSESLLLGMTIGPSHALFDPGKMGSYFQNEEQAKANRSRLSLLLKGSPLLASAIRFLREASRCRSGLYITF